MARPTVVKKLWELIRNRSLQDPSDKRRILCDDSFKAVFGVTHFTMFEMNKLLVSHFSPVVGTSATASSTSDEVDDEGEAEE